jgi:hypothetical protein
MANTIYFNVPIALFAGFMSNSIGCLNTVVEYAILDKAAKGNMTASEAAKALGVSIPSIEYYERMLVSFTPARSPIVGVNAALVWDYKDGYKTDFEKACFLAFIALKSILGGKPYCKATNDYLLARMAGKAAVGEYPDLPEPLKKYSTRYQLDRIKNELVANWGLTYYSRFTRGFYFSFTVDFEKLVRQAENKREATKQKARKNIEAEIIKKVLANG